MLAQDFYANCRLSMYKYFITQLTTIMKTGYIYFATAVFSLLAFQDLTAQIDLDNLYNYSNQTVPNYIGLDNTTNNNITNAGATLGRVLFYDKLLSVDNSTACGSCHLQEHAFGDPATASVGANGTTGRHSMRLINARFSALAQFFWDRRANTLEQQTTMPIQDHAEMGFSGANGDPDLDSLFRKMNATDYYSRLFRFAYGDSVVTEQRIQLAIAKFIRSIQSFDSKYDQGRVAAPNDRAPFNNFTANENEGKALFLAPPTFGPNGNRVGGGLGCGGCHRAPEFDIDPVTENNGVIGSFAGGTDLTNTRSPSLRDVMNPNGQANGPFMHDGSLVTMEEVLDHYNSISLNADLDIRLRPGGSPQQLNLTPQERSDVIEFLKTLTGSNVYTDVKWSDPFNSDGSLTVLPLITTPNDTDTTTTGIVTVDAIDFHVYPTLASGNIFIKYSGDMAAKQVEIYSMSGQLILQDQLQERVDVSNLQPGNYFVKVEREVRRFIKTE